MVQNLHSPFQEQLSSWREYTGAGAQSPDRQEPGGETEAFLRTQQRRISLMCQNHVLDYAAFFAELQTIARQESQDPQLQQRVADMCTFALRHYEQSSALLLQMGIEQEIK